MNLKRIAQPASEPLTLDEAKLHLRVDQDEEDSYIGRLIAAARWTCEDRIRHTLISTPWRLVLDCFQGQIVLPMGAVLSVDSFSYIDADGQLQNLDAAGYQLAIKNDVDFLAPAVGQKWPATQVNRYNAVQIEYTAGFGEVSSDVPEPLRQWMLLAIGDMYANRERSSDKPVVPQNFADGLLDDYKMVVI